MVELNKVKKYIIPVESLTSCHWLSTNCTSNIVQLILILYFTYSLMRDAILSQILIIWSQENCKRLCRVKIQKCQWKQWKECTFICKFYIKSTCVIKKSKKIYTKRPINSILHWPCYFHSVWAFAILYKQKQYQIRSCIISNILSKALLSDTLTTSGQLATACKSTN